MKSKPRGIALVINNKKFRTMKQRSGTDVDCRNLEHVFKQLGFNAVVHKDLKGKVRSESLALISRKNNLFITCTSVNNQFWIKEEIHTRISLILNEREKKFPTEQCKNDQNRIKNKEVMTFWNFTIFRKTLLDQSLWIFKWASWWCHSLTILYSFHIQKWQKSHISTVII